MNIDTRYAVDPNSPFKAHSYQYGEGDPGVSADAYVDSNNPGDTYQRNPFWKRVNFFYSGAGLGPAARAEQIAAIASALQLGNDLRVAHTFGAASVGFISTEAMQDGPVGDDPRTPTLVYRRDERSTSTLASYPVGSRYAHHKQDFSAALTGQSDGQFAAGWDDPNQQASWSARSDQYFGRPWSAWVDP